MSSYHTSFTARSATHRQLGPAALALATTLVGCSQPTVEREDSAPAAERTGEIVDNGDGTWSYALADDFDPETLVHGNIVTWRYDGQARFSSAPTFGAPRTFVVPEDEPSDPLEQIMQMRRVDRDGRVWVVDEIDEEAWAQVNQRHPAEAEGDEPDQSLPLRTMEEPLQPGTVVTWQPASWTHSDCIAGGGLNPNELHVWEGDSRNTIVSGHTARQQTAVTIRVNGAVTCSGVIIHQDEVLTAAHCVSDDSNNPIDVNTVQVCRDDISACIDAEDIDFSGSYGGGSGSGGGTDFEDDWAIVELEQTWSAAGFGTAEDMDLSSAGDDVLADLTNVHNLAFPQFLPGCSVSSGTTLIHNQEWEPIASIQNKRLRLKLDGSPGHSGSPIYYCPDGDNNVCGADESGFVIAVFSGWNTADDRHVGPKTASFVTAANVFLND